MVALITSDLHLTDNPHDEYRWGLFPWIHEQIKEHGVNTVLLLGDIADKKDFHSNNFWLRGSKVILDLAKVVKVGVLLGNHDCVSTDNTNIFLRNLIGYSDNLTFFDEPTYDKFFFNGMRCSFIPFIRDKNGYKDLNFKRLNRSSYIFCHETFNGAVSENGTKMEGISHHIFDDTKATIISGDIHVPQKLGNVTYVGAPYGIRFGDTFDARCLLIHDDGKLSDLHYPCIKKRVIDIFDMSDFDNLDIKSGDQVKFNLNLKRANVHNADDMKKQLHKLAEDNSFSVRSVSINMTDKNNKKKTKNKETLLTDVDFFNLYCKREKLNVDEIALGLGVLNAD